MIAPEDLVGIEYRLGADPERHGKADCLSLARHVVGHYGILLPPPQRSWYRRLRRGDHSVFEEELERWGYVVEEPKIGTLALCRSDNGYCLGAYWKEGCLAFVGKTALWRPVTVSPIERFYFPSKQSCVIP